MNLLKINRVFARKLLDDILWFLCLFFSFFLFFSFSDEIVFQRK